VLHGAKNDDPQSWSIPFIHDAELPYNSVTGAPADFQYQNAKTKQLYEEILARKIDGKKLNVRRELKKLGGRPSVENEDVPDDAYSDGAIAVKSIALLKDFKDKNEPFFLTIGFRKPHLPFVAPKKYWDMYKAKDIELAKYQEHAVGSPDYAYHNFGELKNYSDIKKNLDQDGRVIPEKQRELIHGYYASVSYVDAQIGKVLNYLKKSGLEKNTLIVLIGDHGWHLGDHGLWNKHTNFEQATRTPMIILSPNGNKGAVNSSPTELIDVFPTMCEIAGLSIPRDLQGVSLVPIINGTASKIKDAALSQYPRNGKMGYAIRTDRYRYIEWRVGDYKISKDYMAGKVDAAELYDYKKDPLETKNLIDDPQYSAVIKKLKTELDQIIN
jgi:arylsulfatase A-like enzyme